MYVDDKLYTDLIIPEDVTYFTHRFLGCTSIENVVLHDKITGIQDSAFYLCSGISNVYINSLESYYKINFENDTAMPMHDIADLYVNGELLEEAYVTDKGLGDCDLEFPFKVPGTSYFVMGDNRNNSKDARLWENPYVDEDLIIGKAWVRWYPFDRFGLVK